MAAPLVLGLLAALASSAATTFTCTKHDLRPVHVYGHGRQSYFQILDLSRKGITQIDSTTLAACENREFSLHDRKKVVRISFARCGDYRYGWGTVQSVAPGAFEGAAKLGFIKVEELDLGETP